MHPTTSLLIQRFPTSTFGNLLSPALLNRSGLTAVSASIFSAVRLSSNSNNERQIKRLARVGWLSESTNRKDKALETYKQAIHLAGNNPSPTKDLLSAYNNAGTMQMEKKDYTSAVESYEKAVNMAKEMKLEEKETVVYLQNSAHAYLALGDKEKAKEAYERVLEICKGEESLDVATSKLNLGTILLEKKEVDAALNHFTSALSIRENLKADIEDVKSCHDWLSSAYEKSNNMEKAAEHAEKAAGIG